MRILLLLIFVPSFFVCCSKQNDSDSEIKEITITGKWYYDYYTIKGEKFSYDYENEGCDSDFEKGYVIYTVEGDYSMTVFQDCEWGTIGGFEYSLELDKLVVTKEGYPDQINEITLLTETKLGILRPSEDEPDFVEYFKR